MEALAQALRVGEVDFVIVDMYLPVKRKDLFNETWFEAVVLIQKEMYHGVVAQGDAIKLAPVLKEMIAFDNVQTKFLEAGEEDEVDFHVFLMLHAYVSCSNDGPTPRAY